VSGKTQYKYSGKRYFKSGGIADLYTAKLVSGRTVIVREFRETLADNKKLGKLFWQGVQIRNRLQPHPNVLGSLDYGTDSGTLFELIDYVDGPDLRQVLDGDSALTIKEHYMPFMAGIASGIRHIHRSGFFHLDIKPENIMIKTFEGKLIPRITDFDLAMPKKATKISRVGTFSYMAPECLRDGEINVTTDVYAFAVLAYRLWVGELPFPAETAGDSRRLKEHKGWTPMKRLSRDIPIGFSNLIDACLSPHIGERPMIKEVAEETKAAVEAVEAAEAAEAVEAVEAVEAAPEPAILELNDWLADFEQHATSQLQAVTQAQIAKSQAARTGTVLVVEDDPSMADLMKRIITSGGYTVLMAENGRVALEVFHGHDGPIDLVVSDVVMPYIGGIELMNRMRNVHPPVAFILVTGHSSDIDIQQLTAHGAVVVNKPFTSSELLDAVHAVLGY
jgi:CheY-like chemotaxis protein